jgi:hypothetical protein
MQRSAYLILGVFVKQLSRLASVTYLVSQEKDRVPSLRRTSHILGIRRRYPVERHAVIETLPEALKVIKEMNLESKREWAGDYRDAARTTVVKVLKDQMEQKVSTPFFFVSFSPD